MLFLINRSETGERNAVMGTFARSLMIAVLISLVIQPCLAYSSGNTTIIRRSEIHKPSLLDRKFVYMKDNPIPKTPSNASSDIDKNLSPKPNRANPKNTIASSLDKGICKQRNNPRISPKKDSKPNNETWDEYAVDEELDESLEVNAVLIR